jgi:peptide/nickel transport system permease protein
MPRSFWALWRASRKFQVGFVMLLVLIGFALLGDVIAAAIGKGENPVEIGRYNAWLVPSPAHPLGTDRNGRDILAMTALGLRASLQVGVVAGVLSTIVGVIVAFVAGYKGGWIDGVLRTATDSLLVIPTLPLLIVLSANTRNVTLLQVSAILAVFGWPFAARTIRAQVLTLRTRPYVELARATKLSDREIIFEELVPNLLPYIGVGMASASVGSILALAGLEVIGLGPSDALDLGLMIQWAISWGALSLGAWPIIVAPITVLSALFIAVNLINFGLEEIYNPRLRGVAGA